MQKLSFPNWLLLQPVLREADAPPLAACSPHAVSLAGPAEALPRPLLCRADPRVQSEPIQPPLPWSAVQVISTPSLCE